MNVFANDVVTNQTVEIGIMQKLGSQQLPAKQPPPRLPVPPHTGVRPDAQSKQADRPHRDPRRAGTVSAQTYPSAADPRSNLAGRFDAGGVGATCASCRSREENRRVRHRCGLTFINSDVAFGNGHYAYQGNFAGFTIWDVSNPAKPVMASVVECITSQGDPTIIGNLLFVSAEGAGNRNDCGKGGVQDPKDHMAGIRIFDVSNPRAPKLVKNVQTCKGSHTHTVVPSPTEKSFIYVSGAGRSTERWLVQNGMILPT